MNAMIDNLGFSYKEHHALEQLAQLTSANANQEKEKASTGGHNTTEIQSQTHLSGQQQEVLEKHISEQQVTLNTVAFINQQLKQNQGVIPMFGKPVPGNVNSTEAMIQNILRSQLTKTTRNLTDDIKNEKKVVDSIKEDVGYDIVMQQVVPERLPVEYFMAIPYGTTFKSLQQRIVRILFINF